MQNTLSLFADYFNKKSIPYLIVGGLAINELVYNRTTKNIDILILPKNISDQLRTELLQFALQNQLIPYIFDKFRYSFYRTDENDNKLFEVEILFKTVAARNVDKEMYQRAVQRIKNNIEMKFIAIEDLFILKIGSERAQDIEDCFQIVKKDIDWDYVIRKVKERGEILACLWTLSEIQHKDSAIFYKLEPIIAILDKFLEYSEPSYK